MLLCCALCVVRGAFVALVVCLPSFARCWCCVCFWCVLVSVVFVVCVACSYVACFVFVVCVV